jgi:hypothetical protein
MTIDGGLSTTATFRELDEQDDASSGTAVLVLGAVAKSTSPRSAPVAVGAATPSAPGAAALPAPSTESTPLQVQWHLFDHRF